MRTPKSLLSFGTAAITIAAFVFAASCHKKPVVTTTANEDTGYSTDHATTEQTFSDVQSVADQAMGTSSGGSMAYRTTSGCATVHHSTDSTIVDFGGTNCTCRDGRSRRGKIIVIHSGGHYADSGHSHIITFDNYFVNDNQVTGSKTVTNMGKNASGQPYFNVAVNGSVILSGNRGTVTEVSTRTRTWIEGSATADFSDDVYQVTGSGTLTRANGNKVSIEITTPLVMAAGCRWIEAGTVKFSLPNGLSRTLNYGDSPACDDQAILTVPKGTSRTITLP
jgi:hypothetical protein